MRGAIARARLPADPARARQHAGAQRRRLRLVLPTATLGGYSTNAADQVDPAVYAAWAKAVTFQGGAAAVWPATLAPTVHAGKPAARYTAAKYTELFNTRKIDVTAPQTAAPNGYVYVLAPATVIAASTQLTKPTAAEAPLYSETFWQKFGFPDLGQFKTPLLIVGGVLLTIGLLRAIGAARGARA